MLPASRQFEAALEIVEKLRAEGYEAYLAGGCVRDLVLGRDPLDYDVATSATPDVVLGMFPRTIAVGAHFGVVLVATDGAVCEPQAKPGHMYTEVATFRSDGAYSDGRHPDAVRYTRNAEEDVRRRDFTINGLLLDVARLFPQGLKPGLSETSNVRAETRTLWDQTAGGEREPYTLRDQAAVSEAPTLRNETTGAEALSEFEAGSARVKPCPDTVPRDVCGGEQPNVERARREADPSTAQAANSATCSAQDDSALDIRAAVLDYVGGLGDLDGGLIRAIGRAELRFEEDRLRMLRAVRFAARFGFELEAEARRAIRVLAPHIHAVSRERVRDELTKMLTEGRARRAFELLEETGLLAEVLPEVARMKGVEQPPQFHPEGDVWVHTLMLLEQLGAGCPMTLAWGALLHDVGKPPTFRRAPDRIRFDGHVEIGVAMGAEICRRFRFSNQETRQILSLIENHMRFADAPKMKTSTLKRFFRLEDFDEHLALHRMDCMAAHGNLEIYDFVRERRAEMSEEAVRPRPLLTGRELIAAGYQPGPRFKEMLTAIEDAQLEGAIGTPEEALRMVRERFGEAASSS